jgi:hypothetical protein
MTIRRLAVTLTRGGMTAVILRWASGLRFPWLFLLLAGLRKKPVEDSVEATDAKADTEEACDVDDTREPRRPESPLARPTSIPP